MSAETRQLDRRLLAVLVLVSGFSSLVFETLSTKLMTYVFGVSLDATTFVLAVYFLGLTVGSLVFGEASARIRSALRAYGLLELGIGASLFSVPLVYSALYAKALAVVFVFIPAFLMGGTMPLVFGLVPASAIPLFYGINTAGAALGVLLSTYALIPGLGLSGCALVSGVLSLAVAAISLKVAGPMKRAPRAAAAKARGFALRAPPLGAWLLSLCFLTGFLAFAFEVVWFNLLALVLGNSVYAFGVMLFTVLAGIFLGSLLVARLRDAGAERDRARLAAAQLALALFVYADFFLWDRIGGVFTVVGFFSKSFALMEATRFVVSGALLLGPATMIGCSFPLVLRMCARGSGTVSRTSGWAYSANAVGCVVGAVSANLVLINQLGNRSSLVALALTNAALAFALARPKTLRGAAFVAAALLVAAVPGWDYLRMTGGQNVYFQREDTDGVKLLYHRETSHSGALTVKRFGETTTLYTNGKFEGNDTFEIKDQAVFGLAPSVFVSKFGSACNIGLGVGGSLGAVSLFPFKKIDVVELSPDIPELVRKYFSKTSQGALDDPRVETHISDGRNFLMSRESSYDLITLQVTSVWFAGAGNLYNREFYEIVRRALTPTGVFQQWFQIHHLSLEDLARIIKTMRVVFPEATVWVAGHQGVLVAGKGGPLSVSYARLRELDADAKIEPLRKLLKDGKISSLFRHYFFDPESLGAMLDQADLEVGQGRRKISVSTDLEPWLEFSTPLGNADEHAAGENMEWLMTHRWTELKKIITGIPSEAAYQKLLTEVYE